MKMKKVKVGDRVSFWRHVGHSGSWHIEGKIVKMNPKTATIEDLCGGRWQVRFSLLKKVN